MFAVGVFISYEATSSVSIALSRIASTFLRLCLVAVSLIKDSLPYLLYISRTCKSNVFLKLLCCHHNGKGTRVK